MAVTHIPFGYSTPHASYFRNGLQGAEANIDVLVKSLAKMQTMLSGDGTSIAHFDEVVIRYGVLDYVASNAVTDAQRIVAKGIWDELNSAMYKLTTDASVTSVQAAMLQLFNKTR